MIDPLRLDEGLDASLSIPTLFFFDFTGEVFVEGYTTTGSGSCSGGSPPRDHPIAATKETRRAACFFVDEDTFLSLLCFDLRASFSFLDLDFDFFFLTSPFSFFCLFLFFLLFELPAGFLP